MIQGVSRETEERRRVNKYLVRWKEFTAEHDSWEKEEDLENTRKLVNKFKGGLSAEVRRQEEIEAMGEKEFRREILPEKYMAKLLYKWNDGKFEAEYLRKLERNWQR